MTYDPPRRKAVGDLTRRNAAEEDRMDLLHVLLLALQAVTEFIIAGVALLCLLGVLEIRRTDKWRR